MKLLFLQEKWLNIVHFLGFSLPDFVKIFNKLFQWHSTVFWNQYLFWENKQTKKSTNLLFFLFIIALL